MIAENQTYRLIFELLATCIHARANVSYHVVQARATGALIPGGEYREKMLHVSTSAYFQ